MVHQLVFRDPAVVCTEFRGRASLPAPARWRLQAVLSAPWSPPRIDFHPLFAVAEQLGYRQRLSPEGAAEAPAFETVRLYLAAYGYHTGRYLDSADLLVSYYTLREILEGRLRCLYWENASWISEIAQLGNPDNVRVIFWCAGHPNKEHHV